MERISPRELYLDYTEKTMNVAIWLRDEALALNFRLPRNHGRRRPRKLHPRYKLKPEDYVPIAKHIVKNGRFPFFMPDNIADDLDGAIDSRRTTNIDHERFVGTLEEVRKILHPRVCKEVEESAKVPSEAIESAPISPGPNNGMSSEPADGNQSVSEPNKPQTSKTWAQVAAMWPPQK
ncbi:hypothetical protein PG993_005211 [Apiospora rasikravindrae]|uniref:DUF6604 domain-containing protein n=1 Tax=Apiospora rasikravindrae TaxID=990691 RepID=A0ABR1TFK1_9PEZI